ncbi:MAG: hypothetical protein ACXVJ7_16395 [Acidimicrobiia bacterium]
MGRANSRPRKGNTRQHLPKVGSAPELARDGQRDRAAVMDVMGLGNLSVGARNAIFIVGALILVAAIVSLLVLLVV